MKKWFAILTAACLLLSAFAMAEATEASKLPAPEVVSELESAEEEMAEPEESEAPEEEDGEAVEAASIPEAEPSPTPEAAEPEEYEVWFEEGFALTLPEGWVRYDVSDEDRADGIRYILGDGSGERLLYILLQPARVADIEALGEAVENTDGLAKTGDLSFGDTDFVAFIDSRQNASCVATLWGNDLAVFMFTPQSDSDFMLTASKLMESFDIL